MLAVPARAADPTNDAGNEFFEKKIRPLLVDNCYQCHSDKIKEPKSGLRLDSRAALLRGGEHGPAIVPGQPEKSRLILAVSYTDADLRMPKKGKLPPTAIADLAKWVKMGAPWPGDAKVSVATPKKGIDIAKRKSEHWAWRPVRRPSVPEVQNRDWPLDPIDRFILAKLEQNHLKAAAPADRRVWLRRVYFDLIGLPPTPAEIDAFLADRSPNAFEKVVDRLLASPHFGERWGRHWLDLVRYAETFGHEFDPPIPNAHQYRDYVIRALNTDVPYDQFVREHIAGDLIKPRLNADGGFNESILGTGFWFFGEQVHSPVDIRGDEADRIDNKIDVFGKTFLALTISCARCHDHKFDAISQKDYYALSGFILSSSYRQVRFDSIEQNKKIAKELEKLRSKHGYDIVVTLSQTIGKVGRRIEGNLLAARDSIRTGKVSENVEVREWVKHLTSAADDPDDPFYIWSLICKTDDTAIHDRITNLERDFQKRLAQYENTTGKLRRVATFLTPLDRFTDDGLEPTWHPDDVGYDFNAVQSADIRWGLTANRPISGWRAPGAVERDPFWIGRVASSNTEADNGALGSTARYGRILRTDKFTLHNGKLYILVKGQGRIYAAVDSHTLIAGPLHARLVHDFNTNGKWKWIPHDLTPYKGHRLHLEIWPTDEKGFAVSEALESNEPPALKPATPLWWKEFDNQTRTAEDVARRIGKAYSDLLESAWDDEVAWTFYGSRLETFILNHPQLFGIKDFAEAAKMAKPLFREQERLARQVRCESRLAPAMWDGSAVDEHVLIRGSHKAPGEIVPRRFLEALVGNKGIKSKGSGRDILAEQMTNPAIDPFIARVYVNRIWHHLFGRGIVASVDNFGVMGERPTHPELLDYLADRFVREGWSTKRLIRELVLSRTYRMASQGDLAADQADAQNLLLHKARLRRLEGEAIRDAMLAVSGRLDDRMYGKSVPIHLNEFIDGRGKGQSGPLDGDGRRSIYLAVKRNFLSPMLLAFDTPTPFSTMGRRTVSNVPAQALMLMNDPFVHQQAERWADRVLANPGDTHARIQMMYESAFGRLPSADEEEKLSVYVSRSLANSDARKVWSDVAHVLFNVKEFIYLP